MNPFIFYSYKALRSKKWILFIIILFFSSLLFAQAPVPEFSATPQSGCAPIIVNFTDLSAGSPTSWLWNLGNGVTSTEQNPSTLYTIAGTYTITLTATNASGSQTLTKTDYIIINLPPTVDFTVNNQSGCFPLRTQFTDLSSPGSGSITNWSWSFGDGGTSTQQNPQYTYRVSGNYTVILTVTNSNGCIKALVKPLYISVTAGVTADFRRQSIQNCKPPESIQFTNITSGPPTLTYQWDFGDGNTSNITDPANTYTTVGPFTVRLIATSSAGCIDTMIKPVFVQLNNFIPQVGAPDSACVNNGINFQNTSDPLPVSSFWNFGDLTTSNQTNPVKTYTSTGTFTVKLINQYATCVDSVTKDIKINPKPITGFTSIDTISCKAPHTVNFTNVSTGGNIYNWNFGDGIGTSSQQNPVYTYTTTGNFTVTLVVTNSFGCTDTLRRVAYIRVQKPILNPIISPREGCEPLFVNFFANSTSVDSITNWSWNFGDGNTSLFRNPSNTFDSGSYTIKLFIVTTQGCIDSIVIPNGVRVGTKPNAAFSAVPLNVCAFANTQFTDLSTGNPDEWSWDFGDNTTSPQQSPAHAYQDTGRYTVRLIVFNNRCPDTANLTNYITVLPPIAKFNYAVNCSINKRQIQFTDQSVVATGWSWNFGDGTPLSTQQNPSHTYTSLGTYTVTLTVTNGLCSHQIQKTVTLVAENIDFSASLTNICRNQSTLFTANLNYANILSYFWNFGNLSTFGNANERNSYVNSGFYTVRLVVTDINGCRDSLERPNYIRVNGPVANFNIAQGQVCLNNTVQLTNTSATDGINAINRAIWDMGNTDVINSITNPFTYTYPAAGTYDIKLLVRDAFGCVDSITRTSVISVINPKAAFTADTLGCPGSTISFTNQSTGGSGAHTYLWRFDDGFTSTQFSPTHTYSVPGLYKVKLYILEPIGCIDSTIINVRIDRPKASFTVNDSISICQPFEAKFTSTSTFTIGHSWNFNDGNTSGAVSPSNYYFTPGTYTVRLIVQSPGSCFDTAYKIMRVGRDTGTLNYAPLSGCAPLTVNLQTRTDVPLTYIWDFGDGNTITTKDSNRVHTYDPGFYIPKIVIRDGLGCVAVLDGIDTIKALGSNPNFGIDTALFCDRGTVQFTDSTVTSDGVLSYLWNFGDGNTSNSITAPSHTYNAPGLYTVTLTVRTRSNCVNTKTKTALVKVVPSPQINILGDTSFCIPASVLLQGQLLNPDTSIVNWRWNVDGQIFNIQNPPNIIRSAPDTIFAQLIAINGTGCKDTSNKTIVVHPLPTVNAGRDTTICLGTFATLNATGADSAYVWNISPDLSCTNCANPVARATNNTWYYVRGISKVGCNNKDSVFVTVKKPFTITAAGGDTICLGESKQLNASFAENYLWTPATGLSNPNIANPIAKPDTTTTYTVFAFDSSNCFSSTASVRIVVYEIPLVNAGKDTVIRAGSSVQLSPTLSGNISGLLWTPATGLSCITCPNPVATPLKTTTYRLFIQNPGVCFSSDEIKVTILCDKNNFFMPNAFTPNGDNLNDRFYVIGNGITSVLSMRIYNRWGNKVFERLYFNANDRSLGWDGTFNGQPVPPGVFTYAAEIICSDGGIIPVQGTVIVIR